MSEPLHRDKDVSFMARAACQGADPEIFFPERGDVDQAYKAARRICSGCEVREACLEYAMTPPLERAGIYGGLSARERGRIRGRRVV